MRIAKMAGGLEVWVVAMMGRLWIVHYKHCEVQSR